MPESEPGIGVAFSLLGLRASEPGSWAARTATLRESYRRGVRLFELPAAVDPLPGVTVLRQAIDAPGAQPIVLVAEETAWRIPSPVPEGWEVRVTAPVRNAGAEPPERFVDGPVERRLGPGPASLAGPPSSPAHGRWRTMAGSLLDGPSLESRAKNVRAEGDRLLLTDPFAGGRLSGAWPGGSSAGSGPPAPPLDVGELRRLLEPVLRLSFLTKGGRRSLPQAAVGFARALGAIPSLPFRTHRDLDAWLDLQRTLPLGDEELARWREPPKDGGPG